LFALTTVVERKVLGRIQNRYGPNRVGPWGFLQFAADGIKALTKEDVVPAAADRVVHFLAPLAMLVPVLLAFAVLPVGRNMVVCDLDAGVLFFFAVGAARSWRCSWRDGRAGTSMRCLGAMRAMAQMISYEVPLILSSLGVIMVVGSLSPVAIVEAQNHYTGWVPHWHLFTPWGLAGFFVFVIAAAAESNRSPFDLPEGESELVAGYFTEYSGFKFALFFLAEYLGMFAICRDGDHAVPGRLDRAGGFSDLGALLVLVFLKLAVWVLVLIWVRGTVPRLRVDQLMNLAWKFLLPVALAAFVAAGLWLFLPPGPWRWGIGRLVGCVALRPAGAWVDRRSPTRETGLPVGGLAR
jgi:NADH-quinone oxidoreductase subunit H